MSRGTEVETESRFAKLYALIAKDEDAQIGCSLLGLGGTGIAWTLPEVE